MDETTPQDFDRRPSETPVAEAAPLLEPLVELGAVVHVGGPVDANAVLVVAEFEDPEEAGVVVFDGIGFMSADSEPEESWLVLDPEPADVFAADSEELWSAVLARQGGALGLLSRMPPDPSLN